MVLLVDMLSALTAHNVPTNSTANPSSTPFQHRDTMIVIIANDMSSMACLCTDHGIRRPTPNAAGAKNEALSMTSGQTKSHCDTTPPWIMLRVQPDQDQFVPKIAAFVIRALLPSHVNLRPRRSQDPHAL